jgi:hypothetical protein
VRWLLTASLARVLADGPDRDRPRAVALGAAAVDGAQVGGDRRTLAYALFALCDVRWEPGTSAERLRIAGELAAAAAAASETELLLEAHLSRLVALLELGVRRPARHVPAARGGRRHPPLPVRGPIAAGDPGVAHRAAGTG